MKRIDYILGGIYYFSLLLPVLGGAVTVRKMPAPARVFFLLAIAAFIFESVALFMAFGRMNNYSLYQIYFLAEASLIASTFYLWYHEKGIKIAIAAGYFSVVAIWIYFNLIAHPKNGFMNIPLIAESTFFILLTSHFMVKKVFGTTIPVSCDYRFWIGLGLLLNFSGNILLYAGINYIMTQGLYLWRLHWMLNALTNASYCKAFFCLKRKDYSPTITSAGAKAVWDTAE